MCGGEVCMCGDVRVCQCVGVREVCMCEGRGCEE